MDFTVDMGAFLQGDCWCTVKSWNVKRFYILFIVILRIIFFSIYLCLFSFKFLFFLLFVCVRAERITLLCVLEIPMRWHFSFICFELFCGLIVWILLCVNSVVLSNLFLFNDIFDEEHFNFFFLTDLIYDHKFVR